jgi:hypothetical protein
MSNSYTWKFGPFDVAYNSSSLSDVVTAITWNYSAETVYENNLIRKSISGIVTLEAPQTDTFIPYTELTVAAVESWVIGLLGQEKIRILTNTLDQAIQESTSPVTRKMVAPWVQN